MSRLRLPSPPFNFADASVTADDLGDFSVFVAEVKLLDVLRVAAAAADRADEKVGCEYCHHASVAANDLTVADRIDFTFVTPANRAALGSAGEGVLRSFMDAVVE